MNKPKIVFTGGHHNSALVVAQALQKKSWEVIWFGHRHSMDKDRSDSAEYQEVVQAKIPFYNLRATKIHRLSHPVQFVYLFSSFFQAFFLLLKIKPDLIFSFGGYLAPPVVLAGRLLAISVVTHEQTISPGLANRFVSHLAKKVFVTWPQTVNDFPLEKTVRTGLPLRPELLRPKGKIRFPREKPIVYLSGGKQGSHVLNQVVYEDLPLILRKYNLIHQTGSHSVYHDLDRLREKVGRLDPELRSGYLAKEYFFADEVGKIFNSATVAVGRAGAHFCAEIGYFNLPSVLVPLPFSSRNEQQQHARFMAQAGLAVILDQQDLCGSALREKIDLAIQLRSKKSGFSVPGLGGDTATNLIIAEIEKLCR